MDEGDHRLRRNSDSEEPSELFGCNSPLLQHNWLALCLHAAELSNDW